MANDLISRQAAIDACIRVRELRAYDEIEEIKTLPSVEPDSDRYEKGIIEGRVQMRTELLTKLKEMVGEEIWTNI